MTNRKCKKHPFVDSSGTALIDDDLPIHCEHECRYLSLFDVEPKSTGMYIDYKQLPKEFYKIGFIDGFGKKFGIYVVEWIWFHNSTTECHISYNYEHENMPKYKDKKISKLWITVPLLPLGITEEQVAQLVDIYFGGEYDQKTMHHSSVENLIKYHDR